MGFSRCLGLLVPMALMFIGTLLFSFLHIYQYRAPQLTILKQAYEESLPKINEYPLAERMKTKLAALSLLIFPLFVSSYSHILTLFFAFAFASRMLLIVYGTIFFEPFDATVKTSSVLYCGLYIPVFGLLYNLDYQAQLFNNEKTRERSVFNKLVPLLGKEAVYGVAGNPFGDVTEVSDQHQKTLGRGAIYTGLLMVLGGVIKYNLMEKDKLHKENHLIHRHNLGIRAENHQHTLKLQHMERAAELAQDQREQEHKHRQLARQQEMNHEKELADIRRKEAEAKAKAQIAKSQALLKTAAEN